MAGRFVALPEVPEGTLDWQTTLLSAMKEDVELLVGSRGEADSASTAVVRSDITAQQLGLQGMHSVTLDGDDGYNISGQDVASLNAMRNLRDDMQNLANDVFRTREALDLLIKTMKG